MDTNYHETYFLDLLSESELDSIIRQRAQVELVYDMKSPIQETELQLIDLITKVQPAHTVLTATPKVARELADLEDESEQISILVKPFSVVRLLTNLRLNIAH